MTAEEFIKNVSVSTSPVSGLQSYLKGDVLTALKGFAQMKVKEALEAVADKAEMIGTCVHQPERQQLSATSVYVDDPNGPDYTYEVDRESILNAYPIENIK